MINKMPGLHSITLGPFIGFGCEIQAWLSVIQSDVNNRLRADILAQPIQRHV
jgi:hypothetical protein